jgi:pentapeptide MXKDX repeat protein
MIRSCTLALAALLALSAPALAQTSPSPAAMKSDHAMKGGAMKGGAMKGDHAMKGGAMKGGSMKGDHAMKGGAMKGDHAMKGGAMKPSPSPT